MIEILPGVLAENAEELQEKLSFPGFWQPGMTAHVDILDGSMFGATCFCDATAVAGRSIESETMHRIVSTVPNIELHLMVQNPLPVIEQWRSLIPETTRAIVHMEIERSLDPILDRARELGLETGIALCPETPPDALDRVHHIPDRVLIMGVHPGASAQPFLGEPILAKIRRLRVLHPLFTIAVDGGIRADNAQNIVKAGANALIATSAIWQSRRPLDAYTQLTHSNTLPDKSRI